MKRISLFAASFIFAAIFTVSASAQAGAASASPRFAVVNTAAFGDKDGITRFIGALTSLENELKPVQTELRNLTTRYETLGRELENLQKQVNTGTVPINEADARKKADEFKSLELQIKRKQEDANGQVERRRAEVLGPVTADIMKALQEFTISKGYDMIFDGARLDEAALIVGYNPAKVDVTKEFITFFNARPAGAATAAAPR